MKIETEFELYENTIAAFDKYFKESNLNRDDVASSFLSNYINARK